MRSKINVFKQLMCLSCLGFLMLLSGQRAIAGFDEDKTLSPYFFVQSDNAPADRLPLKSTKSDVTISGVIADVTVSQVYKNEGKSTLEAVYVFPASTRAAVYAMKMTIGERVIIAKIQEKNKARETYEQALQEGKTASLLEQQRPNVFQMNVGNILPGDEIKVIMSYTEVLVPEDGVYEFVYPTVVGPRYSNLPAKTAPESEKWVANPYLRQGENASFTFAFDLTINSGTEISKIFSPSHDINIEYTGQKSAQIELKDSNQNGNRDVVIRYVLAGEKIEGGLLMNKGEKENFFLLMIEPPKRVELNMIVPREYIFVIDVSGSMYGFPIDTAKDLLKSLFANLRPSDTFNVMLFSGANKVLFDKSRLASKGNLEQAFRVIDREHGSGSTELMPALRQALALPKAEANGSRNFVIITDGYVSVEKDAFEYIRNNLDKGNVFAFGIGSSVNRYLIEGMARAGMGETFIVLNRKEAAKKALLFKEYIESPVLTDIRIEYKGFKVSDVEPASVPDMFAQKPVMIFGKFRGNPDGQIIISGKTAKGNYRQVIDVKDGKLSADNIALRYLWARHRIMRISDMNKLAPEDKRVKQVTELGLEYNLLTEYTSFVAVDNIKRAEGSPEDTVNQPLPLPQGVSDYAVADSSNVRGQAMKCMSLPYRAKGLRGDAMKLCEAAPAGTAIEDELVAEEKNEIKKENGQIKIVVEKGGIDQIRAEQKLRGFARKIETWISKADIKGELEAALFFDRKGKFSNIVLRVNTLNNHGLLDLIDKMTAKMNFGKDWAESIIVIKVSK